MGDAVQAIQSITADVFVLIEASAVIQQSLQTVSVSGTAQYPSALQAKQGLNAQAFISIEASVSLTQPSQSITSTAFYYDVAINVNMMQSLQSVMIDAQSSLSVDAVYLEQPQQYMSAAAISKVITAKSARQLNNRAWILRAVRNKGER